MKLWTNVIVLVGETNLNAGIAIVLSNPKIYFRVEQYRRFGICQKDDYRSRCPANSSPRHFHGIATAATRCFTGIITI